MASNLPPNTRLVVTTPLDAAAVGTHPDATFLFQGSQFGVELHPEDNRLSMATTCDNVYGKTLSNGILAFCVETIHTGPLGRDGRHTITRTHNWHTEEDYIGLHMQLWHTADMEPNRDYNIGIGLRSPGGAHLGGENKLCERDGRMKLEFIRSIC